MENLEIYEKARVVPPEAQKQFNNGKFSGTDINPMWRIKKLTEIFGPCGIGWYTDHVKERAEEHGEVTMAIVNLDLYVKWGGEWSKPIYGTGGNVLLRKGSPSDEGYKMAYTDALSVACKALGIGADVYFSGDKTKYTQEPDKESMKFRCEECGAELRPYLDENGRTVSVRRIAETTKAKYGKCLCVDCASNA